MNDPKFLRFLDLFQGSFGAFKIDYPMMRKILKTKLLLDGRRTSTNKNQDEDEDEGEKNVFLRSLPIYGFMGIILIPFLFLGDNYLVGMSLLFSLYIFLMMTSLISDFSSVLLDIRDNSIILTKPIDSRTLNIAKILHIFFYVSMITLSLIGPSLIIGLFRKGFRFFLLYLISAIFIDLFIIMITALIYLFILKFFNGEKLKDIITYIQIILSGIIAIGGQLVGRMFDLSEVFQIQFQPTWWSYLLPPVWFASFFDILLKGNRQSFVLVYGALGILMPILSIGLYILFIPSFESNLRKLNQANNSGKNKIKFTNRLAGLVCSSQGEENFFRFTTNMIRSERSFKLRVYPSLVYSIIFPIIFLFSSGDLGSIGDTKMYFSIYFLAMILQPISQIIIYSENHRGSFVYRIFPIDEDDVYRGSLKSLFFNLVNPLFLLMSIIYIYVFKFKVVAHLLVVYLNLFLGLYLIFKFKDKTLPFSQSYGITNRGNFLDFLKSSLIIGGLIGVHYLSTRLSFGVYIYLLILLIVNKLLWKAGFKQKGQNYD